MKTELLMKIQGIIESQMRERETPERELEEEEDENDEKYSVSAKLKEENDYTTAIKRFGRNGRFGMVRRSQSSVAAHGRERQMLVSC